MDLMMLFLSRSDLSTSEFSFFMLDMLEVVDYPAESPKCVGRWIEQELEAPVWNSKNRILQFDKPEDPVLSELMAARGAAGRWRGYFSYGQATSGWRMSMSHDNLRGWSGGY
jgi:hypothetical protein